MSRFARTQTGCCSAPVTGFRSGSAVLMLCALILLTLMQVSSSFAAIDNTARAVGVYSSGPVISPASSQSIPVVPANPQIAVSKIGALNDDDGTSGLSAGDTITYTIEVSNPGNISLTNLVVNDPLISLVFQGGDTDGDNAVDPGEVWVFEGSYTITIADLASQGGGDGDIDNTVTASSDQAGPVTVTEETMIDPNVGIDVAKTGTLNDDDGIPGLSAGDTVSYQIEVSNSGSSNLTNVSITDVLEQSGISTQLNPVLSSGDVNGDSIINAGETWVYTLDYTITQDNIDDGGNLVNTASVLTDQIGPRDSVDIRLLPNLVDSFTMTKTASHNDGDGDNLADFGETIDYAFAFTNTGNRTLTNLRVDDPLPGLSAIACANDGDLDGDIDSLAPLQTAQCTASYTVQESDVLSGGITNTATASATRPNGIVPVTEDDSANDNSVTTPTDSNFEIDVTKSIVAATEVLPNIVELQYRVNVVNLSSVTQSNVQVRDDIVSAISAPAELVDVPVVSISGFTGTGGANSTFNGNTNQQLLASGVELPPLSTGEITITVLVDRKSQGLDTLNVAFATTDQIIGEVPSDDPAETPGNPDDQNPTVFVDPDADGDGATDALESAVADRDGDGIVDAQDYDPTGYFYCEADGRILTGGLISVQNVATGGIQSGIGNSNDIVILEDGSNGFYQFYVTAAGRYRLLTTLPAGGIASTNRLSNGLLDVTSLLPNNPGIIGAGEFGNSGLLADFAAGANPFFTEFEFEPGDPSIFNNNIPLGLCGTPELVVDKQVVSGPDLQADGSFNITYRMIAENTGSENVNNLSVVDNLDATFGAGNHSVVSLAIENAPAGFTATANSSYTGSGVTGLLTAGGVLPAGERLSVLLSVNATVPGGTYTNVMNAGGNGPTGIALTSVEDTVDVTIANAVTAGKLVVTKSTPVAFAPIGGTVPYTITFQNPNTVPVFDVDLVDRLPRGFTYVPGSALIDGVQVEPAFLKPDLVWGDQDFAPGQTITVTLNVVLGAGITGTEFTNLAFALDGVTGALISNRAQATIELEVESVFQCSHVIGRVFDDLNRNGYHDQGEPGVAGVRLVTVNGLLITTDEHGRYHIACDAIPDDRIGSNYILKLDDRTLPTGYRLTSENPRVVRLTQGKISKLNFAVANLRRITLALQPDSFVGQSTDLTSAVIREVARLLPLLEEERSVLVLAYPTGDVLRAERLEAVRVLVDQAWKSRKRPYRLKIENNEILGDLGRLITK